MWQGQLSVGRPCKYFFRCQLYINKDNNNNGSSRSCIQHLASEGVIHYIGNPCPAFTPTIVSFDTQIVDGINCIPMVSPYPAYGYSGPHMLLPSTRNGSTFRSGSPDSILDPVKWRSEWYKDLDFEDEIFIPRFCNEYSPQGSPTMIIFRYRDVSNSKVAILRKTNIKMSVVVSPESNACNIISSPPSSLPVIEHANKLTLATLPPSALVSGNPRRQAIETLNSANFHFFQSSPSRTLARCQALLKPTSTTIKPGEDHQGAQEIAREIMAEQQRINNQRGTSTRALFIPSRAALGRNGRNPESSEAVRWKASQPDEDVKHYGQPIDAHKNCAIFITGIPIAATYADVLDSVRGGKVYACRFEPDTGKFPTRAVKLVFFTRVSAELFMHQNDLVGVFVLGTRIRAVWNRIRYETHTNLHQSRVLNITGPTRWVRSTFLEDYFKRSFDYDLDRIVDVPCPQPGCGTRAWHFACFRAQAEFAKMVIERELKDIFTVEYGADLCDKPWI